MTPYEIKEDFLTKNRWSRPGTKMSTVLGLVIHWVANPKSTPQFNRTWFEKKKDGYRGFGSAHYIIGLDGKILQCIPENEIAYHCGGDRYTEYAKRFGDYPNNCTLSIETCHLDWDGNYTDETLRSLTTLSRDILIRHKIPIENVCRHYDITGRSCPRLFVTTPSEWNKFLDTLRWLTFGPHMV